MRRALILAAALSGWCFAARADASFTVTAVPATVAGLPPEQVAYDVFAKSNATGTGDTARLLGYQLKFHSQGAGARFLVRDTDGDGAGIDGTPDTVDLYNDRDALRSSIRPVSTLANGGELAEPLPANLVYQEIWPYGGFVQPNPWHTASTFTTAVAYLRSTSMPLPPLATAGRGVRLARIVVDQSESFWVTGTVADVAVNKNAYFVGVGPNYDIPPTFGDGVLDSSTDTRVSLTTSGDNPTVYSLNVDFRSTTAPPASFSLDTNLTNGFITITSPYVWNPVSLTIPTGGSVITGSVRSWAVGVFDTQLTGTGSGTDSAILRVTSRYVVPEPAGLGLAGASALISLCRLPRWQGVRWGRRAQSPAQETHAGREKPNGT